MNEQSETMLATSLETAVSVATAESTSSDMLDDLDELDDLEFLLEEIENKIAPLALAW